MVFLGLYFQVLGQQNPLKIGHIRFYPQFFCVIFHNYPVILLCNTTLFTKRPYIQCPDSIRVQSGYAVSLTICSSTFMIKLPFSGMQFEQRIYRIKVLFIPPTQFYNK
jgi:hypothetical protein